MDDSYLLRDPDFPSWDNTREALTGTERSRLFLLILGCVLTDALAVFILAKVLS